MRKLVLVFACTFATTGVLTSCGSDDESQIEGVVNDVADAAASEDAGKFIGHMALSCQQIALTMLNENSFPGSDNDETIESIDVTVIKEQAAAKVVTRSASAKDTDTLHSFVKMTSGS